MATTDIVINGLYHMENRMVDAMIGGLDCGSYVVTDGAITVPIQSDPDDLCTGAYLYSLDVGPWDRDTYGDATTEITVLVTGLGIARVYVPVVIGYSFTTIGRLLRPATESATKSPQGPALGKLRRVNSFSGLFINTIGGTNGVQFGTDFNHMHAALFKQNDGTILDNATMFSGVHYNSVEDHDTLDGMLTWTMTRPYPCTIAAIAGFIETKER